jgi:hypothetical protein
MVTDALTDGGTYIFTNWPRAGQKEIIADNSLPGAWDTTCPTCVGNLGSSLVLTSFAGAGVSLQEYIIEVSGIVWDSGNHSNGVISYQFDTIAALYTGVSREPISAYDALRGFGLYASSLIAIRGIKLISTHIRDWASVEEPEWKQLVIDFEVEAQPDVALALWDRLSDELGDFLAAMRDESTPDFLDSISITVQWK